MDGGMSFLKPEGIHFIVRKTSIVGATFGYAPEEAQQGLALVIAGLFCMEIYMINLTVSES